MHASAPGRIRAALAAGAAVALGLTLQPVVTAPAQAGTNCGSTNPLLPPIGDCEAPESTITKKPPVFSEARTALFEFTTVAPDDDDPDVTFQCRLESGFSAPFTVVQDWTDCSVTGEADGTGSLGKKLYEELAPGDYTFSVRATDVADDLFDPPAALGGTTNTETTPAQFQWSISETAPDDDDNPQTTITSKVKRWHLFRFLGIEYQADEDTMGFICKANGQEVDCTDRQANLFGMGPKDWTFTVAAVDSAGNVDPTPAVVTWSVPRSSPSLKGSDGWKRQSAKGYFLDAYMTTKKRGQYINMTKEGFREMALVATRCPECGTVDVLFEGKLVKRVDLSSKKRKQRQAIPLGSWKKKKSGWVRIEVVSKGKPVIIEGFGFSLRRTS